MICPSVFLGAERNVVLSRKNAPPRSSTIFWLLRRPPTHSDNAFWSHSRGNSVRGSIVALTVTPRSFFKMRAQTSARELVAWHLLATRSGGIQGFSISQYLIALSTFVLLIDRKRSVGLAILAGISAAAIPYGYAGIRLLLPLLLLLAIVSFRRIEKYNLFAYLGTILAICAIQIGDYPRSLQMYFFAKIGRAHV